MSNWLDPQLPLVYGDQYEANPHVVDLVASFDTEDELVSWLKRQAHRWFEESPAALMPMTIVLGMRSGLAHILKQKTQTTEDLLHYAQSLIDMAASRPDPVTLAAVLGEAHMLVMEQADEDEMGEVMRSVESGVMDILTWGQPAVSLNVFRADEQGRMLERMLMRYINEESREQRELTGEWRDEEAEVGHPHNDYALKGLAPSA